MLPPRADTNSRAQAWQSEVLDATGSVQGEPTRLLAALLWHMAVCPFAPGPVTPSRSPICPTKVVELYQEWAGPCKCVKEVLKRLFFENGGGLPLKFLTVRRTGRR